MDRHEIPLTRGVVALVNAGDFPALSRFRWFAVRWRHHFYAARHEPGSRRSILMHREILGAEADQRIDHLTHHPLAARVVDNRRSNLRLATERENQRNREKRLGTISIFKGVTFSGRRREWKAQIGVGDRRLSLGNFTAEAHAAYAYDLAAVRHFGEFALTNFPVPGAARSLFTSEGT